MVCHRLHGTISEQKIADLPKKQITPSPPFTYSGVDYFGPFYIKQGRKGVKHYGVLFMSDFLRVPESERDRRHSRKINFSFILPKHSHG